MTRRRLTLLLVAALSAAAFGFAASAAASPATATNALNAPTNDECFKCHGSADVKDQTIDVDGVQKSIYVDRAVYEQSRHGKLACTSCHLGFKPGPHDAEQTKDWLADRQDQRLPRLPRRRVRHVPGLVPRQPRVR